MIAMMYRLLSLLTMLFILDCLSEIAAVKGEIHGHDEQPAPRDEQQAVIDCGQPDRLRRCLCGVGHGLTGDETRSLVSRLTDNWHRLPLHPQAGSGP